MPFIADLVAETSNTAGVANQVLNGAKTVRYRTFAAGIGYGQPTYYMMGHPTSGQWERGIGTLAGGPDTLVRTTILDGSGGPGVKVNFAAGVLDVFIDVPASKVPLPDPNSGLYTFNAGTTRVADFIGGGDAEINLYAPTGAGGVDHRRWGIFNDGTNLTFRRLNDIYNAGTVYLQILDSGAVVVQRRSATLGPMLQLDNSTTISGRKYSFYSSGPSDPEGTGSIVCFSVTDNKYVFSGAAELFAFFAPPDANQSGKTIYIPNVSSPPVGNPTAGHFLYVQSGALKGRGSSGTITTIANADPHCPSCGRDFVLEWDNKKYGTLRVCLWCLTDEHDGKPFVHREVRRGHEAHLAAVRGKGWATPSKPKKKAA